MSSSLIPYQQDASLSQYMRQIGRYDVLEAGEEYTLAIRYRDEGDVDAARQLVLGNLRFVIKVAFGYRKYGVPVMELIQEGNLGLMEAVSKFKPEKGYRLITYAVWWIRAYIQKYILDTWSIVRRGTTRAQRKLFYKLNRKEAELAHLNEGEVSSEELAEALDVTTADIDAMRQMLRGGDVSLDAPMAGDEQGSYVDFLADATADQESMVIEDEQRYMLSNAVDTVRGVLSERDQMILDRRILAEDPDTLEVLSRDFKVSRERVRQLESGIRKKIAGLLTSDASPYPA